MTGDVHRDLSRRDVLGGLVALSAGALVPGTTALAPSAAGTPASAFRVDMHHHFMPPKYIAEEHERNSSYSHNMPPSQLSAWSPQQALEAMDQNRIATATPSISPPAVSSYYVTFAPPPTRQ